MSLPKAVLPAPEPLTSCSSTGMSHSPMARVPEKAQDPSAELSWEAVLGCQQTLGHPQGQFRSKKRFDYSCYQHFRGARPRVSMTSDDISELPISHSPTRAAWPMFLAPDSSWLGGCGRRNEPPLHESWEAWELSSGGVGPSTTLCCHTPKAGTWHHQPLEPPGAVVTPAVTGAASQETPGVMEFWMAARVCTSHLLSRCLGCPVPLESSPHPHSLSATTPLAM